MGKLKDAAITGASQEARRAATPAYDRVTPAKFTYALSAHSVEIRDKGWYVAKSVPSFTGDKPEWAGPFETIEAAVLAIGRRLATEIADRHARSVDWHKIKEDDPIHGLKKTRRARPSKPVRNSEPDGNAQKIGRKRG